MAGSSKHNCLLDPAFLFIRMAPRLEHPSQQVLANLARYAESLTDLQGVGVDIRVGPPDGLYSSAEALC